MRKRNFVSNMLLVLAGFGAAVALNLFPINKTVHGAVKPPEPPPAALKSVAHDSTLRGDGTTASPLGIANAGVGITQLANGAVTASKLSTAAIPSLGQVLGFNGTNLAWQNAPVGGVRVVDQSGKVVGTMVDIGRVLRQVGAFVFLLRVSGSGFSPDLGNARFYHTTSDCSNSRYYAETGTDLVRNTFNFGSQVFYTAEIPETVTVRSYELIGPPSDPNQQGPCHVLSPPGVISAGLLTSLNLSTLGLASPFHIEF